MARQYDGRIDDATHYVTTHQANVDGYGFSEDARLGLGDWALLDTTHQETAIYYRTSWNCSGGSATLPLESADLARHIPPGHTNMYIEEKRAVVVHGHVRAVWPKTFDGAATFRLLVAGPTLPEALVLGPGDGSSFPALVKDACELSALTGRPVVVSRQLAGLSWH